MRFLTRLIARFFRLPGPASKSSSANTLGEVSEINANADDCTCEPLEVPDAEHIARAVYFDFHLKGDRTLKWQAFKPPRDRDDLSTMRTGCIEAYRCKSIARALNEPHKTYEGFALLLSGEARSQGFGVLDSRDVFCGHADLVLNNPLFAKVAVPDAEPPDDITYRAQQRAIAERLIALSILRLDPSPEVDGWPAEAEWLPSDN